MIELLRLSSNTDSKPVPGEKVALIVIVIVLLKVCVPRPVLTREVIDRLEAGLEKAVISLKKPC
jgi:hypothetical protein